MSPAQYAPLPNPRSAPGDAEREMDDAFDDDDDGHDNDHESTPLTIQHRNEPDSDVPAPSHTGIGAYDFERDYEWARPPPGSPPPPTSLALPSNGIGNSNGYIPTTVVRPTPRSSTISSISRALRPLSFFGKLIPSKYQRLPSDEEGGVAAAQVRGGLRGGGIENDGVFANVSAKPGGAIAVRMENGDIHMVPEVVQALAPPSYAAAQLDATPAYWENTVHAPSGDISSTILIDELPAGTFLFFFATTTVSWFFHLPGFLLTYLLSSTHAGRYGSQMGLALTLIEWGFEASKWSANGAVDGGFGIGLGGSDGSQSGQDGGGDGDSSADWPDGNTMEEATPTSTMGWEGLPGLHFTNETYDYNEDQTSTALAGRKWVAFVLMALGWFLLLISIVGFVRVKRYERSILASRNASSTQSSASQAQPTPEDVSHDLLLRRNLEEVFGIPLNTRHRSSRSETMARMDDEQERIQRRMAAILVREREVGAQAAREMDAGEARALGRLQEEARLERDLVAAGLL